jgi:uncharacterized phage protein gp47/JayE
MATSEYGVTAEGFKRKRLAEIRSNILSRFADKTGVTIANGSNSVIGMLTDIHSYELSDIWSGLEGCYNAMYPNSANGVSLTNSAGLTAIRPISAEQTTVILACYGTAGTTITEDAQIADSATSVTYTADEDTEISMSTVCDCEIVAPTIVAGTIYSLTIDGTTKTYTAVSGNTKTIVLTALYSQFSFTDRILSLSNEVLSITMTDQSDTFTLSVSNLTVQKLGSPVNFTCDTYGSITPILGNLTTIITSITGWNSVNNAVNATIGRADETDTELRQRWSQSVYKKASAMIEAIQANVYENVTGVTTCLVYENSTDTTDADGRLPHSIEVIVLGGEDTDIAKEIWTYKTAGIDTNGSISTEVADSQGVNHTIKFNRPTEVKVWLSITVTKNSEETWSENNATEIKELLLTYGDSLTVGQDVILQKMLGTIYSNTTGIGYVAITATTGDTAGTYTTDNISITARQLAVFDTTRIEVTVNV